MQILRRASLGLLSVSVFLVGFGIPSLASAHGTVRAHGAPAADDGTAAAHGAAAHGTPPNRASGHSTGVGTQTGSRPGVIHGAATEQGVDRHSAASTDGGAESKGHGSHGSKGHGTHGHVPHFEDINWIYGFLGESDEVTEPSVLWRTPGMPVPFGALLLNTAILFYLIGRFGGPAISKGLKARKERIAGDIQTASAMKEEAEGQLQQYEEKLAAMDAEMERIKSEMKEQAELERARIIEDAKARREQVERDARDLIEQELSQARATATRLAVSQAVDLARDEIRKSLSLQDQDRLATNLVNSLSSHFKAPKDGGQA
ncbi:MAG: ATP synthase F0 subunit B [Polyangiaceae bacterium]|nr:ATP synthase F0 subunit B [Polyangiaceae bacterium]